MVKAEHNVLATLDDPQWQKSEAERRAELLVKSVGLSKSQYSVNQW